jgi:WD40 repeat protein
MLMRGWFAVLAFATTTLAAHADADRFGDPLPPGAKTRLGTIRYRFWRGTDAPTVTPDLKTIYFHDGREIHRYDIGGAALGQLPAGSPSVMPIAFSGDGTRAVSAQRDTKVWEVATGKIVLTHQRAVHFFDRGLPMADLSGDGKVLVLGAAKRDGKEPFEVLVWDVDGNKEIVRFVPPQNEQAFVALARDGKMVATWGNASGAAAKADSDPSKEVHFWDATTGKPLSMIQVGGYGPSAVAFSPDSTLAAVAGTSTIELVDPRTGATKHQLLGRSGVGRALTFSPDGKVLFATNYAGVVQRWRTADGVRLSTTEPPGSNLRSCSVRAAAADRGVAWALQSGVMVVWEVPSGKLLGPQEGHVNSVQHLFITADSKFVLASAYDGPVLKWELATGKLVGPAPGNPWPGRASTSLPLVEYAVGGAKTLIDDGGGFGVHDAATGMQEFVIPTNQFINHRATFAADGSKVITTEGHFDGKKSPGVVGVWDVASAKRVFTLALPGHALPGAALTLDGKHLVTVSRKPGEKVPGDFFIQVWEVPGGAKKGEYSEEAAYGNGAIAVAPDNTAAVVTSKGKLVRFDLATSKVTPVVTANDSIAGPPVFSPDGKSVAIIGQSFFGQPAPVVVVDWATGKVRHTFACPDGGPVSAAFSPDGRYLITGTNLATAIVWDLTKGT